MTCRRCAATLCLTLLHATTAYVVALSTPAGRRPALHRVAATMMDRPAAQRGSPMPWKLVPNAEVSQSGLPVKGSYYSVDEADLPEDPTLTCWLDEAAGTYVCTEVSTLFADFEGKGGRWHPAAEAMQHTEDSY